MILVTLPVYTLPTSGTAVIPLMIAIALSADSALTAAT